jgi:N6-adenosine-specific RNA methylase IME4
MSGLLPIVPEPGAPITADDVALIEARVTAQIATVSDIDALNEFRSQAAAIEAYLRSRGLQRPMLGAQRRVEARIGQLAGPTSRGKRTDLTLGHDPKSLGDPHTLEDFRVLANALGGNLVLEEDEWRKSRRALVALVREKLGLYPPTPPMPDGKFRLISADPAWRLDTGPDVFGGIGERGHEHLGYRQMSVEAIKALPVIDRAADDAHLYLWTTNRYIEAAYDVARAWGFAPSVMLVWAKTPRGVGLGDAYRITTEFCLYCRRGSLKERRIVETTWFNWPRGRHSEKPKEFYEMVETVGHSPRLEMFAREQRTGWTAWGDEVPMSEASDAYAGSVPDRERALPER